MKRFWCVFLLGLIMLAAGRTASAAAPDCGENTGKPATAAPIPIGAISTLSGVAHYKEAGLAATAFFKCVNANGGIHGRPIQFHELDDQSHIDIAAQAAKRLVEDEGSYILVGGTGIVECVANAGYYVKENILDIGIGAPPQCYNAQNIDEINAGPRQTSLAAADYARRALGAKSLVCLIAKIPGAEYICGGLEQWGKKYGVKVTSIYTDPSSPDYPSEVLQILAVHADAVMTGGLADQGVQILAAAEEQDGAAKMKWVAGTTFYTVPFPRAIDSKYWNDRLWVNTELGALDGTGKDNQNWLAVEKAYGGKDDLLDSFAQADYIAARIAVRAMLSIKNPADINRGTVTAAIRDMKPYYSDILCSPWYWGGAALAAHNPNHVTRMVVIENGKWKQIEGCFPDLDPGLKPIIALENKLGINRRFNAEYETAK